MGKIKSYDNREEENSLENLAMSEERRWRNKICEIAPIKTEQERRYLEAIKKGDLPARDYFIRANQRLVLSVAISYKNRYPHLHLDILEMVGEGNLGLIKALDRFDLSRRNKFSTFARPNIEEAIRVYLETQGRAVRVPRWYFQRVEKVRKVINSYLEEEGRKPTFEEIATKADLTLEDAKIAYSVANTPLSIDPYKEDDEDNASLLSVLSSPEHLLKQYEEAKEQLMSVLTKVLTIREREILRRRHGIGQPEPMTLMQVAKFYGVKHQGISQIEQRALRKLETEKDKYKLEELLGELKKLRYELFGE